METVDLLTSGSKNYAWAEHGRSTYSSQLPLVFSADANVSFGMSSDKKRCPLCGSPNMDNLGTILHREPVRVAGVPLDLGDTEFSLLSCKECTLQVKWPGIPESLLLQCYARASESNWGEDPNPTERHFDKIRSIVEKDAKGRNILDVGCFNGAMLHYFGPSWIKYGLEPSRAAANLAATRDIKILGATIDEIKESPPIFDVITAIDVIEHLVDPKSFFAALDRILKPDGLMIFSTADTGSWPWRLEKNRYWYCSLPEHVCFWSFCSIQELCATFGWEVRTYTRMRHQISKPKDIATDLLRNLGFLAGHSIHGLGMPSIQKHLKRSAPTWITARDHLLCSLARKRNS